VTVRGTIESMTQPSSAGPPLTHEDVRELSRLLARYAEHDLDQFDHWKVQVPGWGTVFIAIQNQKPSDIDESVYTEIWPLPTHLR
jgi:hypothetical protein